MSRHIIVFQSVAQHDPFRDTMKSNMRTKNSIYENCTSETLLYYLENALMNYTQRGSKANLKILTELEREILHRLGGNYAAFEDIQTGGK